MTRATWPAVFAPIIRDITCHKYPYHISKTSSGFWLAARRADIVSPGTAIKEIFSHTSHPSACARIWYACDLCSEVMFEKVILSIRKNKGPIIVGFINILSRITSYLSPTKCNFLQAIYCTWYHYMKTWYPIKERIFFFTKLHQKSYREKLKTILRYQPTNRARCLWNS